MEPNDYTTLDQKLIEGMFKANMSDVTFLKKKQRKQKIRLNPRSNLRLAICLPKK